MHELIDFKYITGAPVNESVIELQDGKGTYAYKMADGYYITYGPDFKPDKRYRMAGTVNGQRKAEWVAMINPGRYPEKKG